VASRWLELPPPHTASADASFRVAAFALFFTAAAAFFAEATFFAGAPFFAGDAAFGGTLAVALFFSLAAARPPLGRRARCPPP
jgi:hypothetical protein